MALISNNYVMKKTFKKPIIALAALGVIGAGAGAGALASAQTATSTADTTTHTRSMGGDMQRAPGVHGKITAISGNTLTVADERAGTTYTVDASAAAVTKATEGSAPTASTVSALVVGDTVGVEGTVSGTNVAATKIMSGFGGKGFGGMRGHGRGASGTVTSVSGNTITIAGDNGTSYTINASDTTKVSKMVDLTVADIKVGDRIGAQGALSGTTVTATHIMDGVPAHK